LTFNVLTDPWIPLAGEGGLASYVELLTGSRDAPDLVHPRDDCRFFARMLLSALTQALFPAANAKELRARIEVPLPYAEVLARVEEVRSDFELVGVDDPWMQSPSNGQVAGENETPRVFLEIDKHTLFKPAIRPDALCAPCAVPMVYGLQSFVPMGGSGYPQNVRGQPPATTLVISRTSVRRSIWANTLHGEMASRVVYGPDPDRPWRFDAATMEKDGALIGLVEGLFWKPRSLRLIETSAGVCVACGRADAPLHKVVGFAKGQRRSGGLYRHQMTPCRVRRTKATTELQFVNLQSDRPAWTALADFVSAVEGDAEGSLPAPVVSQWTEQLARPAEPTSLLVLDFGTKQMAVLHRFVEGFPLSLRLTDRDVIDAVRTRIGEADGALEALRTACVRLHMKTRPSASAKLGRARKARARKEREIMHDVTAAFWQSTEPAFWASYEAAVGGSEADQVDAEDAFRKAVSKTALHLFDAHASPSIADPARVAVLAEVRSALAAALPRPARIGDGQPASSMPPSPIGDGRPEASRLPSPIADQEPAVSSPQAPIGDRQPVASSPPSPIGDRKPKA
jgi:CRISPR type I-E-associated protein CasA/Cse1